MAWRERRKRTGDAEGFDLRMQPADRIGGPPRARQSPRRNAVPRRIARRGAAARAPASAALIYWGAVLALWAVIAVIGVFVWVGIHLPPIQSLEIPKRPPSVLILGDNGRTLATRGEMGGAAVPLKEMPAYVPNAFIAIEDRRFYSHYGIDPMGLIRAGVADVLHRGVSEGGSTITQQLAKNLFLTQERTSAAQAAGGGAGAVARTQIQQDTDSRALSQPRLFRLRRLRRRSGGAALFRQVGAAGDARRRRRCWRASSNRRRGWRPIAIPTAPNAAPRSCIADHGGR